MDQASALQCSNLHKRYADHAVLRGIDLQVQAGAIHGLVGLNGAGKTTTLECVLGLRQKDTGDISVLGFAPWELFRANGSIAVVFDSPCLHPQLTVRQSLQLARLPAAPAAYSLQQVEQMLGIERYAHFKVRQLSLGNRRRTAIAQALINRPRFIILDEPFNGLDAGGVEDVLQLIQQLNRDHGTSFLLASHQLAYLEKICTHIAMLHDGKIQVSQTVATLLTRDQTIVTVVASDSRQAKIVLGQMKNVEILASDNNGIQCRLLSGTSAQLNKQLVQLDVSVEQLLLHKPSLESVFYANVGKRA